MTETEIAEARRTGELEAELADTKLRLKESLERERRIAERSLESEEKLEDALRNENDLREQIERYAKFNRAVETSLPWRLIQALRRLVGREW